MSVCATGAYCFTSAHDTDLYASAHHRVFFEPRPATLTLFEKFNTHVADLTAEWWERIKDSRRVAQNNVLRVMLYDPAVQEIDRTASAIGESVCDYFGPYHESNRLHEIIALAARS